MFLYSVNGELQWKRDTKTAIVNGLDVTDDNQRILFKGWGGAGVVSFAGQVEWSRLANRLTTSRDLGTLVFGDEPNHGPGWPGITVADGERKQLWFRWASVDAFISASGHRILATVDINQDKKEADLFGTGGGAGAAIQLLARDATVVATFPDYRSAMALSDDGERMWLRAATSTSRASTSVVKPSRPSMLSSSRMAGERS